MHKFAVDPMSALPPYVQLKEQIKLAYATGHLQQGDVLPSVRTLATELGIGEAYVRRAYRELYDIGLLSSQSRKRVMVNPSLSTAPNPDGVVSKSIVQCDRFLDWAEREGVSPLPIARLLTRRAIARERQAPYCIYVDASERLATTFAAKISKAWEVSVRAMTLQTVEKLSAGDIARLSAILVNSYQYESLLHRIKHARKKLFPVSVRQSEKLLRKLRRLPAGSKILLIQSDEDFARIGTLVAKSFASLLEQRHRFESMALRSALGKRFVPSDSYRLTIVSVHVWDEIPETVRRRPDVVCSQSEPDMQSLEEIRVRAGVIV